MSRVEGAGVNSDKPGQALRKPASTRFTRQRTLLSAGSGGHHWEETPLSHTHVHTCEYSSYGFFIESSQGRHMEPMQMPVSEQADVNMWPLGFLAHLIPADYRLCSHFRQPH